MRTQMKWMVSLVFATFVFTGKAQTTKTKINHGPTIAFRIKPSIEKRLKRTEKRVKPRIAPSKYYHPIIRRNSKG